MPPSDIRGETMKRGVVITALIALLVCTPVASAQEWVSWKSRPAQQPAPESVAMPPQEPLETTAPVAAPASATAPASSQLQRSASAKDNWALGSPTPALSLYAAQSEFAHEECGLAPTKENERFYHWAIRGGLAVDEYRRKDEDFARIEKLLLQRYHQTWSQLSDGQKSNFCKSYSDDVSWAKDSGRMKILDVSIKFRSHFSPPSKERIDRAKKANIFAAILSLGFTAAGVNQVNQHDFSTARQFNNYGGVFANLINDPGAVMQTPCESYLPFLLANIRPEDLRFDTYYSIRDCTIQ